MSTYKYFLDFGTQHGHGLDQITKLENLDLPDRRQEQTKICSFEPNPHTFQKIKFKQGVQYYNMGIADKTGFYDFNCEEEMAGVFTGGGSSLLDLSIWDLSCVYTWSSAERFSKYKKSNVFCLSICDLLDTLTPDKNEKSILAKFDIEGTEYSIFEQLEKTDNFKWFQKIYVEFHDDAITTTLHKDKHYWIRRFPELDIEYVEWH